MSYVTYEVRVYEDGTKKWLLNNKRHREDGPAVEYYDGDKSWYLNDVQYTEEDFNKKMAPAMISSKDGWFLRIDYQSTLEMTVAEVGKALGRKVKIIG